ncbi:metallophosphoesterase [Ideonella sp. 4Y16]|uniref:metallophosphoesterase family protein n=1 Tax=Ideonella alba TaxID=2824118 RepID=UPI001B362694|nr:metallophosphoesterase [Ideonella alba]MBQ0942278.1 metallophosphoesterase [Ideonella alba]
MEADWKPVLQLVHVTDLHVKHITANPAHALTGRGRWLARKAQRLVEKWDVANWNEGTQGHFPSAPESFRRFLVEWRRRDPLWRDAPIWLVDTGDRTAFGDAASLQEGARYLSLWQQALGNCPLRSLYGNHDAWPGTLPLLLPDQIDAQRRWISATDGWSPVDWLRTPLSVPLPGGQNAIELFALDSVCRHSLGNTRAIGELDPGAVEALVARMRISSRSGVGGLRILAMHHPLAFPWERHEVRQAGVLATMRLKNDERMTAVLRNDSNDPPDFGPLMHLVLSGHTHLSHPASGLSGDVTSIHQGGLAPTQLQLVGGSLMLNKSRRAARGSQDSDTVEDRSLADFVPATVNAVRCQAQILQFMACAAEPEHLLMLRTPVLSVDGSRYEAGEPDGTKLVMSSP